MKSFLVMVLSLASFSSFAQDSNVQTFAACVGGPEKMYVNFKSDKKGFYIEVSNDEVDSATTFVVTKMVKIVKNTSALVPAVGHSWAIRQALKSATNDRSYGQININAKSEYGDNLLLNLNTAKSGRNLLDIDGMKAELNCPASKINL